jgi:23S rRNA (cytosine1962-C5)-methyltransferase
LQRAWNRRGNFHEDANTTAYRIVHGEADGMPGLRIERYGDALIVLVLATCQEPHIEATCVALHTIAPTHRIVVRLHLDDLRREEAQTWHWIPPASAEAASTRGAVDAEEIIPVKELGVQLGVRPFAGLATGLYIDQRGTRAWLRKRVKGKRVLNLFAYTGVFSVSALAAGASEAVDVDLSAPSLAIAADNAQRAGVTNKHRTIKGDCREVLRSETARFDFVICDPPTAAMGDEGWILRRDYGELLALAWQKVAPGGTLVACCNTLHGKPFNLQETVTTACVGGVMVPAPDLGADLPQLPGFPEGRPFRLFCCEKPA